MKIQPALAALFVLALAVTAQAAETAKTASAPKPVATLGTPHAKEKWTSTTYEAATAEANKKLLAAGRQVTVTGEVVDVSCYLQMGKRGEAHVACGTKCITNGQPIGIVDRAGNLYLVMAEEHHPRRDGETDLKTAFLPYLAKTVTVNGVTTQARGYRALFVRAGDVGALSIPTKP